MKYKELIKQDIEDWDGNPFKAFVTDVENADLSIHDEDWCKGKVKDPTLFVKVVGYSNHNWITETGNNYLYAYPITKNTPSIKRMTNRELAKWLAQGNGEWAYYYDNDASIKHTYSYNSDFANDGVPENICVRKWDSDEWVKPTNDLLIK